MKDTKREHELFANCPVMEAIIRLALPTVIGQIILVVYNMADTLFVCLTGSDAMITSVTVTMPAFMFLSAISNLFGVGGASVISRALGAHDQKKAGNASAFACWGCLALTMVYSLATWLLRDGFVDLLGGLDPLVHQNACDYLLYTVVIGGAFTSMNALLSHLIRAEGRSFQASLGVALGGILNVALDPLFMFVILPSGMEIVGAALATMISNLIALIYFVVLIALESHKSVLCFKPTRQALADRIPRDILVAGLPACMMTLCENISYAVLDRLMAAFGTAMQAGLGVAKKVNMLAHSIVRGMAQGVLPLIGYNFGAGNIKRMKSSVLISTILSVTMAMICMAANLAFSNTLISVFIQHGSESVDYGARFLRILCIGGPFSACAYAFISFFQATGEGLKSFMLAILRKGILDIPLMFALGKVLPVYGIVWATPIADVICCGISIVMFASFMHAQEKYFERQEKMLAQSAAHMI